MDPRENRVMPVVVEPVGGGNSRVMWVANHVDAALIVARGYRFTRIDVRQWLAERHKARQQKIAATGDGVPHDR